MHSRANLILIFLENFFTPTRQRELCSPISPRTSGFNFRDSVFFVFIIFSCRVLSGVVVFGVFLSLTFLQGRSNPLEVSKNEHFSNLYLLTVYLCLITIRTDKNISFDPDGIEA